MFLRALPVLIAAVACLMTAAPASAALLPTQVVDRECAPPNFCRSPTLAIGARGQTILAWRDSDAIRVASAAPGGRFGPPRTVSTPVNPSEYSEMRLAIDTDGRTVIAWTMDDLSYVPLDPRAGYCCRRVQALVLSARGRPGRTRTLTPPGHEGIVQAVAISARATAVTTTWSDGVTSYVSGAGDPSFSPALPVGGINAYGIDGGTRIAGRHVEVAYVARRATGLGGTLHVARFRFDGKRLAASSLGRFGATSDPAVSAGDPHAGLGVVTSGFPTAGGLVAAVSTRAWGRSRPGPTLLMPGFGIRLAIAPDGQVVVAWFAEGGAAFGVADGRVGRRLTLRGDLRTAAGQPAPSTAGASVYGATVAAGGAAAVAFNRSPSSDIQVAVRPRGRGFARAEVVGTGDGTNVASPVIDARGRGTIAWLQQDGTLVARRFRAR